MEHGQNNASLKTEVWDSSKHLEKKYSQFSFSGPYNYLCYQDLNDFGSCKPT